MASVPRQAAPSEGGGRLSDVSEVITSLFGLIMRHWRGSLFWQASPQRRSTPGGHVVVASS